MTVGRPSKLTPEIQERIVTLIVEGSYPEIAAQACGIGSTTFFRWMALGKKKMPSHNIGSFGTP